MICHCAKSENKEIELQSVLMLIKAMGNHDFFFGDINLRDLARKETDMSQHLAHGIHDRGEIQIARCDFVKHRREQEEVIPIDQGDLDGRVPSYSLLKVHGDGETRKTTAKNKYLLSYRAAHPSFLRFPQWNESPLTVLLSLREQF